MNKDTFLNISDTNKEWLLINLRTTLKDYFKNTPPKRDELVDSEALNATCGVFVTLYKNGELAGCIGQLTSDKPLYKLAKNMIIASAFNDHRFNAICEEDLNSITIEISILSPLKKIATIDEIELGKHGILIKQGIKQGTFLPKVAIEQKWNLNEFLGYCSKNKAGLGWDGWKNAEIYTYEALVFSDACI